MSTAIEKAQETAVERQPRIDVASQLMQVIAANPTAGAENLKALLDGMERITKWQAEQEFTAAFARLKFPPIQKKSKGHTSKYASYDDIQEIIDPILAAEGFTLTFSSGAPTPEGIPTYGLLSHVGGHSRQGAIYLPPDGVATRAGGMNMNSLQAIGSSTSYGMRYVAKLMLNLRFVGEDDNGDSFGTIGEREVKFLQRAILTVGVDETKLLAIYGAKALSDIPKSVYRAVQTQIEAKYRTKLQNEGDDGQEISYKLAKLWTVDGAK